MRSKHCTGGGKSESIHVLFLLSHFFKIIRLAYMKRNGIFAFEGSSVSGPLDGIFGLMCAERKLCPRCYKELSVYPQMPILLEGCQRGALRVWAEWFHRSSLVVRDAGAYLCLTCIVSSEAY